jgi:DnaK suppressor protein
VFSHRTGRPRSLQRGDLACKRRVPDCVRCAPPWQAMTHRRRPFLTDPRTRPPLSPRLHLWQDPPGMDKAHLARFTRRLKELEAALLAEGDIPIEPTRTDPAAMGGDEDGQPLVEMSQVIASKRNQARAQKLAKVRKALDRIAREPDLFGLCGDCEEPIGKRLEAMPFADLCLECQSTRDAPRGESRRHLTDFK